MPEQVEKSPCGPHNSDSPPRSTPNWSNVSGVLHRLNTALWASPQRFPRRSTWQPNLVGSASPEPSERIPIWQPTWPEPMSTDSKPPMAKRKSLTDGDTRASMPWSSTGREAGPKRGDEMPITVSGNMPSIRAEISRNTSDLSSRELSDSGEEPERPQPSCRTTRSPGV